MSIYLLRHGQTEWNLIGRCQGHTDIPLNENGINMVRENAKSFKSMGEDISYIISSPLSRAHESAKIFSDTIEHEREIIIEDMFKERCFGVSEGMLNDDILREFPDLNIPDMEPVEELFKRVMRGIEKYSDMHLDSDILITTHGAVIKVLFENSISHGIESRSLVHAEPGDLFKMDFIHGEYRIEKITI